MAYVFSRPRPPVQHIDRRELYTDLETRIHYLHSFLDFSSNDIEALMTGAKYIKALIPALVNIVYKKLLQYDITARAFITRSTSYEGPIDEQPDEDSPQIQHRKMFLRGYLTKLCSDPSRMEFWEYLDKVGLMHVGRGRTHPLHIEYVHIGATLGMIQDVMTEAILGHPKLSIRRKTALIKALGKVIWIQNDLFAKWYVRDGDEYTSGLATPPIEEEGYLHGKKVIDGETEEDEDEARADGGDRTPTSSSPSQCPFAGFSASGAHVSMEEAHEKAGISRASHEAHPPATPTTPAATATATTAPPATPTSSKAPTLVTPPTPASPASSPPSPPPTSAHQAPVDLPTPKSPSTPSHTTPAPAPASPAQIQRPSSKSGIPKLAEKKPAEKPAEKPVEKPAERIVPASTQ